MKSVHQLINSKQAVFFCNVGQVGINGSGFKAGMSKNGLDMTKA